MWSSDTKVTTALNYGASDDYRASSHVSTITEAFLAPEVVEQGITLDAIELGHEPDRYGKDNYYRSWDPKWSDTSANYLPEYVSHWRVRVNLSISLTAFGW